MKKTLVAVAAFAAVTGAMADVAITGNIDQAITNIKSSTSGTDYSNTTGLMSAYSPSFITFTGSEDLGSGLKANFKLENGLGINSTDLLAANINWNNVSSSNREAWVGVSGDFGSVQFGNQYAPVFNTAAGTDPNGVNNVAGWLPFTVIYGNGALGNSNAITYTSPSLAGVTVQLQQVYGTTDTLGAGVSASSAHDGTGLSINYAAGPFTAGYAQHQKSLSTSGFLYGPTTQTSTAAALGSTNGAAAANDGDIVKTSVFALTYDLGVAKVSYLNTLAELNSENVRVDTMGVTLPLGAVTVGYSYSNGQTTADAGNVKFNGQQLGVYYAFSKRTTAYFSYNTAKDTTADDLITTTAVGIKHSF